MESNLLTIMAVILPVADQLVAQLQFFSKEPPRSTEAYVFDNSSDCQAWILQECNRLKGQWDIGITAVSFDDPGGLQLECIAFTPEMLAAKRCNVDFSVLLGNSEVAEQYRHLIKLAEFAADAGVLDRPEFIYDDDDDEGMVFDPTPSDDLAEIEAILAKKDPNFDGFDVDLEGQLYLDVSGAAGFMNPPAPEPEPEPDDDFDAHFQAAMRTIAREHNVPDAVNIPVPELDEFDPVCCKGCPAFAICADRAIAADAAEAWGDVSTPEGDGYDTIITEDLGGTIEEQREKLAEMLGVPLENVIYGGSFEE